MKEPGKKYDFLLAGMLFLLTGATAPAQPVSQQVYDFSVVGKKINGWVDSGYYPGAAIIIVQDNCVLYEQYFGSYTSTTVAYIASAGKWLGAAVIAAVVDEGKLSWNDMVKKWLPAMTGPKGEATLRQLFSHTAGYPDYQPAGKKRDDYQTLQQSLDSIIPLPADTLPGAVFHYGGLAMQVAGRMAELATGKDWETLFRDKIAGPLHMDQTHFAPVDTTPGHSPMIGGGARTSLYDYAHFLSMIINNGVFEGRRVLSVNAIREMQDDQLRGALVTDKGLGDYVKRARGSLRKDIYGLGEWREEVNEKGDAILISSPSWAGAYPWIDKKNNVYGFFLTRVNVEKASARRFSSFYASPVLPLLVREVLHKKK